jgi:hypothetical protein
MKKKPKRTIPAVPEEIHKLISAVIPPEGRFTAIRLHTQIEQYGQLCYRAGRKSAFILEKQRRARRHE